jgi:phage terminase large subunit-like protein
VKISEMTRGEKVIAFIERYLKAPEGDLIGQPIKLLPFQRKFILEVFDNPNKTRKAYLSIARKNSKTATIACIALAFICGPLASEYPNARIISGALSKDQAAEVYNYASKMIMLSEELSAVTRLVPSQKKIIGIRHNIEYQAVAAEGKKAHGKSPLVAILDEVGQIRGTQSDFVEAIVTSQGAYSNAILFAISTQAPTDADLFSVWLDDAANSKDPKIVSHVYAADKECDIDDREQWAKANPALGVFRSLADMEENAERASRMPSFENSFRWLFLNQRIAGEAAFVSPKVWSANSGKPLEDAFKYGMVFGGLDLSAKNDLTAFALAAYYKQKWNVRVWAWTPEKTLLDREKLEKVPYSAWVKAGHIKTVPGASIEYDFVVRDLKNILDGVNLKALAFDKWHIDYFKQAMKRLDFEANLVPFGQGFQIMTPAINMLEGILLNENMLHGNNPILEMSIHNAKIESDAAGNRKFTKMRSHGRIDPLIAVTMAVGISAHEIEEVMKLDEWLNDPCMM